MLNTTRNQQNGKHVTVASVLRIREKKRQSIVAVSYGHVMIYSDVQYEHVHFSMWGKRAKKCGKKLNAHDSVPVA